VTRKERERLDVLLFGRGLAASRQDAQAMIMAAGVLVDGKKVDKPGSKVPIDAKLELLSVPRPFASRGGLKLDGALEAWRLDVAGKVCLDVGISTGGFTDCLLQRGAVRVYGIDVGYGQLDWRLRRDSRVILFERENIRTFDPARIPVPVDLAVVDVSFISLGMVIPCIVPMLKPGGEIIALVKPQFEVGKGEVGKGGVVRDPAKQKETVEKVKGFMASSGFAFIAETESPVQGPKGNREFFLRAKKEGT